LSHCASILVLVCVEHQIDNVRCFARGSRDSENLSGKEQRAVVDMWDAAADVPALEEGQL
jgi:hypothetical protein